MDEPNEVLSTDRQKAGRDASPSARRVGLLSRLPYAQSPLA